MQEAKARAESAAVAETLARQRAADEEKMLD